MFKVGDTFRVSHAVPECFCGCWALHTIVRKLNELIALKNIETGIEIIITQDVLEDAYIFVERESRGKTGFGKFICRIEE